jgi:hypothetical protein
MADETRAHPAEPHDPEMSEVAIGLSPAWVHGTRLGRDHRSVRQHLVEDHGCSPGHVGALSDGGVHGMHDGAHGVTWAYAEDLPHTPGVSCDIP